MLAVDAVNDGGLAAAFASSGERLPRGIELLELSTEEALDEYLKIYLRFPIPPSRLGPLARIFDYVATAAPGVREILTIGKIAWEVREGGWDAVIVDAPATGHLVELLDAPANLNELIGIGPLAQQTRWVADLLADPEITGVVLATTPEELPVNELLSLQARLLAETDIESVAVVVNRMPPTLLGPAVAEARRLDGTVGVAAAVVAERSTEAVSERSRLDSLGLPILTVPESPTPVDTILDVVAAAVDSSMPHAEGP